MKHGNEKTKDNNFNFMIRPGVLAKAYKHERLFAWDNVASGKTTEEGAEEEGGGANNRANNPGNFRRFDFENLIVN